MSSRRPTASHSRPFAIRLTEAERRELERRAGEMALGSYIKAVLFAEGAKRRTRAARAPVKDHRVLAELLACLGSSRLSETLARLADAVDSGVLHWDADAPKAIKTACADIAVMRLLLMKGLGFRVDPAIGPESLSQSFTRAAREDPDRMEDRS